MVCHFELLCFFQPKILREISIYPKLYFNFYNLSKSYYFMSFILFLFFRHNLSESWIDGQCYYLLKWQKQVIWYACSLEVTCTALLFTYHLRIKDFKKLDYMCLVNEQTSVWCRTLSELRPATYPACIKQFGFHEALLFCFHDYSTFLFIKKNVDMFLVCFKK